MHIGDDGIAAPDDNQVRINAGFDIRGGIFPMLAAKPASAAALQMVRNSLEAPNL